MTTIAPMTKRRLVVIFGLVLLVGCSPTPSDLLPVASDDRKPAVSSPVGQQLTGGQNHTFTIDSMGRVILAGAETASVQT